MHWLTGSRAVQHSAGFMCSRTFILLMYTATDVHSTACTVRRLRTSWNCANQSQMVHCGNISDLPPDSSWSYRATESAFMADVLSVGLSVWLVCRSGIPDSLQNPVIGRNSFGHSLKTYLFATYWCIHHIRGFTTTHYINVLFYLFFLLTRFKLLIYGVCDRLTSLTESQSMFIYTTTASWRCRLCRRSGLTRRVHSLIYLMLCQ